MIKDWYTSEDLNKRMAKEMSTEQLTKGNNEESNYDMLHLLMRNQNNYKKPKQQKITSKDLTRNDFLGEVLNSYQEAIDNYKNNLHKKDGKRYVRSRAIFENKKDMACAKDALLGVFGYKTYPMESTVPDYDLIDFSNPVHVKALLPLNISFDPNNDLSFIILDLNEIIEGLDEEEKLIVEMLRDEFKIKEVAKELNITYKSCQYKIRKISEKISEF